MIPIEDVEKHESDGSDERDDQEDEDKPVSSVAELRGGESSPPPAEAKGDHSDGEHEEKTEMVDERDEECNEDNSGEITAVESSIMAEPRSSDSGSCIDDPELHVGESSPPPPEAKGDHPDGEDEDNTENPGLPPNAFSAEPPGTRSDNQENDTEDNQMSSRDIWTIKMAIKSGDPKAVDDLMERLSDTRAVDELTTTYGGHRDIFWRADEDGLIKDTTPFLHAARSGNLAVFESVMKAMQAKLSREQVKEMLANKNLMEQSLLSLAALSGSKDVLEAALLVIQQEFMKSEVKDILAERDEYGDSPLLIGAARSGSKDFLEHVLRVIQELFEKDNVLRGSARAAFSLLASAVRSGSMDVVEHVLLVIRHEFSENAFHEIIQFRDSSGATLLACAASSGSSYVFKNMLELATEKLDENKKRDMLKLKDRGGATLIALAVSSGNRNTFETVLETVTDCSTEEDEAKSMLTSKDEWGDSVLARAVKSKCTDTFEAVLHVVTRDLTTDEVESIISSRDGFGNSLLSSAVKSMSVEMFKAVMVVVVENLPEEEVKSTISSKDGRSLLALAIESKSVEMFKAVMVVVVDDFPEEEVKRMISGRKDLLCLAVGSVEMFKAVMTFVVGSLLEEEVVELLCYKGLIEQTPLGIAIRYGSLAMCETILRKVQDILGHTKMQNELDAAFLLWEKLHEGDGDLRCNIILESRLPKILSMLVRHSARPPAEFLQWAARDVTDGKEDLWPTFTELLLVEVESASNPLIPGMNISVPLAEAAEGAREGERRRISSLQKRVDEFVLEVLERLPQTIQGFDEGMSQCSALFEPEGPRNDLCGRPGPLRVAFERRHQMESLCAVPLVMDYLSRRFTSGLPDMRDSSRVLQDETALSRLASEDNVDGGLVLGTPYSFLRDHLQGANARGPSLTILPGVQFIIAGLLAKPNTYYRVPAMRMAMDFVVYIVMLYFYSFWVLLQEDGPLTIAETFFAFYVLAGVLTEAAEIRRNFDFYLQDPWNFFDALALVMLAGAFTVRLAIGDNPWGRALYALSAPLVFSRILFFVQILQFQGPMIQVMFSMGMVLLQFAVVLLVVMMGFAMALYPLLRDDNDFIPYAVLLLLFKTLLGDVEAFEEFDESTENRYSTVGRLLLAVYLVVMTIMLLNLLIAVLSTKHAKVDGNADKEYKVSRARIIEHYRLAVAFNILPAPFNLCQLILTLPFLLKRQSAEQNKKYTKTMEAVGQVSFWIVLSPLVFTGGVLLWVTSSMYNIGQPSKWLRYHRTEEYLTGASLASDYILLVFWCALGAPLCLLALWLRQPFIFIYNGVIALIRRLGQGGRGDSTPPASASRHKKPDADVQKMLRDAGTGASDLRKYLEDPMCDPKVRPDEVDRGTTVQHMKLLRDRLEKTFNGRIEHLGEEFNLRVDDLGKEFNARVDDLDRKFNERDDRLEKKLDGRVDTLEANIGLVLEILRRK